MWSLDVNLNHLLLTLSLKLGTLIEFFWHFKATTKTLEKGVKYVQS